MTEYIMTPDGTIVEADAAFLAQRAIDAAAPPRVPNEISDRQFFQQMAIGGLITEAEALAAVQMGTLPAALDAFIGNLPEEERFAARMVISGASTFHRGHPLVAAFGAMQGMTPGQIDDLWRAAAAL